MNNTLKIIDELIAEGNEFTYENFSNKGEHGYPASYFPAWVTWQSRSQTFLNAKFGKASIPAGTFEKGTEEKVLGWREDEFLRAKNLMLGALEAAKACIADKTLPEIKGGKVKAEGFNQTNKVFIVHGHDEKAKNELEIFLKEIGLEPIVLHRQADEGKTIIEKFEKHSDVGYAFILLTPDETAYTIDQSKLPDDKRQKELRARSNVIFEFGYFVGRLGRPRVCCLYTGGVTVPSDIDGLVYKKFNDSIEEIAYSIMVELKAAGYTTAV